MVILYGTFFPLIAELVTGNDASIGSPWFNRFATPLAIVLVFFTGIGPLVAWRRISRAGLKRAIGIPVLFTAALAVILALTVGVSESPTAFAVFLGAGFTISAVTQEIVRGVGARRALSGDNHFAAFGSLITRNRRRYGGYIVHVGLVLALFGIAASSSFQTSRDLRMSPGETAEVGDYTVTYERPTSLIDSKENKLSLGAVLSVFKDGKAVTTLYPSREYYSSSSADPSAPLRSFFEGETTSEVGREETLTRDLWTAMQPDLSGFDDVIDGFDDGYQKAIADLPPGVADSPTVQQAVGQKQAELVVQLKDRYMAETPPAEIRFNVNPFVMWFWLGVIVGVGGALFAIWPSAEGRRRRASDVYGARLARELTRA